jgi:ATP/ADP translocase/HEAT repeat protein/CRP-like cAMP-binding protein
LTNTRSGERTVALLMFAYSFLVMTSHNILTPLTEGTFIKGLGANRMPWVQLAAGILIGVIMQLYTSASARVPRRRVIPATLALVVVLLLGFWVLLGPDWVAVGFYLFGLIGGVLMISQFWTLANDLYDARQAKRLFGFIGGGASLGGALGATISRFLVSEVGQYNLLLFSAAALTVCIAIVTVIMARQDPDAGDEGKKVEGHPVGSGEAIRLLAGSRHLRAIALITALGAVGAALVKQQFLMAAEASGRDLVAIIQFLAEVEIYLSLAGFFVQVALTGRIHRSLGLAFALLLLPVALGSTAVLILVAGATVYWAPAAARVLDSTLRYTVDKTTREVLYLPLPADVKYKAKVFVDVTTDRLARAGAALVLLPLIQPWPWGLGLNWQHLSYASLTVTALWIGVALVARQEYLRTFRASIVSRAMVPGAIRTEAADPATVEALVEELANPDESAVLYAIEMLEGLEKHHLVTPLLLQHQSPRVRARALRALVSSRSRGAARWLPTIERMVQDQDVDVRAAALRALAELAHEDAAVIARRHLTDAESRVVVTAAIVLADSGNPSDEAAAEAALARIIDDTREIVAADRAEAATALAHIENPRFRSLLVPLLHDRDTWVVRTAIRSARSMGAADGLFVPGLLSLLGQRVHKAEARETLIGFGESIVPVLAHVLRDEHEHLWIRRHVPSTLAALGGPRAMTALVDSLNESDGFLRYKAIRAIEKLRRDDPSLNCPRQVLESAVVRETSRYYNGLTLQQNLLRHALDADDSLLAQALADKLRRAVDRIYCLLGLLYHVDDVAAARYTIERGQTRRRAAAVEYLDNLLGGVVRRRVMPILDETPLAEKVRHANLVLKSRPRDLEDTLAQLVHDEDPVIAASAIHFVGRRGLWSLAEDLEYVLKHRAAGDRSVVEAASWVLATRRGEVSDQSLPVVEIVDHIRLTPLFSSLSIDELFRIAENGEEVRYPAADIAYRTGEPAEDVFFLIDGTLELIDDSRATRAVAAPAVVNFEEVLQGTQLRSTVRSMNRTIGFRIASTAFLTMVSDNVLMAQRLFQLLLTEARLGASVGLPSPAAADAHMASAAVNIASPFRQEPLLAGATATQLLALAAVATELPLVAGTSLFEADAPPAIYQVLRGQVRIESAGQAPMLVSAGATFGLADTLAGAPSAWRALAATDGQALRIDRERLFEVLADHVDLMQSVLTSILALRERDSSRDSDRSERPSFA